MVWREAWKYQERAYRYCLHDVGHAWQALALSAQAIGCASFAVGQFLDEEVTEFCRLPEDEWPMLIVSLNGASIPRRDPDAGAPVWLGGRANALSPETITYPLIESIHTVTKRAVAEGRDTGEPECLLTSADGIALPAPATSAFPFGQVSRARRSALNFVGNASMSLPQLSAVLRTVTPALSADFALTRFVSLYLYVHQVEGLSAGVYRYWPQTAQLERIKSGDQRVVAAGLSLGQELAGNSCVTFSLVADLDRAVRFYGERGYRYVHFEAGAIGQRFYLAAEALRLRATGIGAFFDEEVHRYLELDPSRGQVVYHFAIGHPVWPENSVGFRLVLASRSSRPRHAVTSREASG